jgi:GT2 family glycosyltransferase
MDAPLKQAYLSAANFSVSRHDFFRLGGFDERLNDAEDLDLGRRAVSAGYGIYYKAEAAAVHHDLNVSGFRQFIKRQRRYSHARRKLKELHPGYYPSPDGIPRVERLRTEIKRKVFAIFVSGFWIISLERNWWKWLPQKIRFKLYDIIVTANGSIYPDRIPL